MELFERVKTIFQMLERDGHSLTDEVGVNIHTFKGYLSKKRQDNLWPLLDKILALHPEISRQWLYFGEGDMLAASDDLDNEHEQKLLDELSIARHKALDLESENKKMEARIAELEAELSEERKLSRTLTTRLLVESATDKVGSTNTEVRASDGQG